MAEGSAEIGLRDPAESGLGSLRTAFAGFDKSKNKGLLLIDEAQVLADKGPAHRSVPQNALRRLRDRQLLIQSDTGVYRFEDETFKEWIQTGQFGRC